MAQFKNTRSYSMLLLLVLFLASCSSILPTETEGIPDTEEVLGEGEVGIDFLSMAEAWDTETVVMGNKEYYLSHEPEHIKANGLGEEEYLGTLTQNNMLNFWKVGTIENGAYEGQSLVMVRKACDGPCPESFFRYAVDEEADTWTLLTAYSDAANEDNPSGPTDTEEADVLIPALTTPDRLSLYGEDLVVLVDPFASLDPHFYPANDAIQTKESFETNHERLELSDISFEAYWIQNSMGCVYGTTPDGVLVRYLIASAVFGVEPATEEGTYANPVMSQNFTLLTTEGDEMKKQEREYVLFAGGCGLFGSCFPTITPTGDEIAELKEVGTITRSEAGSNVGTTLYTLEGVEESSEPDTSTLAGTLQNAYNSYKMKVQYSDPPQTPLSMEEYLKDLNVAFIQLENGRYLTVHDSHYAPGVECGKPVIYLYPPTEQQVSVKVNGIDFTKTIPAHGQKGWTVWASPSGTLKNLVDGKLYPYLFWEGQSSAQILMGEPWTLAKKDLSAELPKALMSMGLSSKETADFMEFWLPRLEAVSAAYVQFNFEGTAVMNKIAPLTIVPQPDTLLRIFMYYQGVSQPGQTMPVYTAPVRHGFSVIEWGGSLY